MKFYLVSLALLLSAVSSVDQAQIEGPSAPADSIPTISEEEFKKLLANGELTEATLDS